MTDKLDQAFTVAQQLPAETQDLIADGVTKTVRKHWQLNKELAEAEKRMDAGEGIEADKVIADLRKQQSRL